MMPAPAMISTLHTLRPPCFLPRASSLPSGATAGIHLRFLPPFSPATYHLGTGAFPVRLSDMPHEIFLLRHHPHYRRTSEPLSPFQLRYLAYVRYPVCASPAIFLICIHESSPPAVRTPSRCREAPRQMPAGTASLARNYPP